MAMGVVDRLEVIHVDKDDAGMPIAAPSQ